MTEENYHYRTSWTLLRNQFPGTGKLKIPLIPKFEPRPDDFIDLLLIGFDKTHLEDQNHLDRMVHFFLYDYRFERVWKNPDSDLERLSRYRAILSPNFSVYLEMAPVMQLYNTFRNRWCGAYWASKGMRVIPTVNWGDESTFDFCFEGIEKGSVEAVSTYMASEHDHSSDQKEWFMAGYNEMLQRIEPEKIICYNIPFPEMQGDIVYVDYERSSWRHMNYERSYKAEGLEAFKIGGQSPSVYDTIVPFIDVQLKGGGSAYGGKWRPNPNKPADQRYVGTPGEIKTTIMLNGDVFQTKIGPDGKAIMERHHTVHHRPDKHTNPHDHEIRWDTPDGHPEPQSPINYPDGTPEFKQYGGRKTMGDILYVPNNGSLNFSTISDFKECMRWGGEVEFIWKGIHYGVIRYGTNRKITIYQANCPETEKVCDTADEALEYIMGGDRLRDVITQITVMSRTV